jgi:glycosyltransferase involved in cell wall biosynthesis
LARAIESVLAQTYRDFEVVVSDDSGRLAPVVERFGDPRLRYCANPAPTGPAGNLRHAVSNARGRLLATLNDDDWWDPRFLEVTTRVLAHDPGVGIVFTDQILDIGGREVRRRFPCAPGRHDRFLLEILDHSIPVSGTVLRRSVWDDGERHTPLLDRMVGDYTVCLRAAAAGHPFHYVPELLCVTGVHRGQGSWVEEGLPSRHLGTLTAFRFDDDPECEALRRARVREQLLARAGRSMRHGRLRDGASDLLEARQMGPALSPARAVLAFTGLRELLMRWGTGHPRLTGAALGQWQRIRPAVFPRGGRPDSHEPA